MPISRRAALRAVVLGAAGMLLAACSPATTAPGSAPQAAPSATTSPGSSLTPAAPVSPTVAPSSKPTAGQLSQQPKSGGTLRYGLVGDLPTLDGHVTNPPSYATLWSVWDRLTQYDLDMKPQPMLAESWDLSSDYRQIKFNLRKGVQFHTGREMTSDDVRYSLLRVRDPKITAGFLAGYSRWFDTFETPDKYTVVLKSNQPRPGIFEFSQMLNIVDKDTTEGPEAKTKAVGTGPFTFVEWVQGDHYAFAKNKNYWRSNRPYLDGMRVNIFKDAIAMTTQFEAGALDVIDGPPLLDFGRIRSDPKFRGIVHPGGRRTYMMVIEVEHPPLDNKLVRQALSYSADRKRFAETALLGLSRPQSLPWDPKSPAFEPHKEIQFDTDRAASLLKQAGVANLELDMLVYAAYPETKQFDEMYQADLAKIGVKLNIKSLDAAALFGAVAARPPTYQGLAELSGTVYATPISLLSSNGFYIPDSNAAGYKNEAYTQLVNQIFTEPDDANRKQLYSRLNDLIIDDAWTWSIATIPLRIASTAKVHDIGVQAHDSFHYWDAWLEG